MCLNDDCVTYTETGRRNIASNTFKLRPAVGDEKSSPSNQQELQTPPGSAGSTTSSMHNSICTPCTVCNSENTSVHDCNGRLFLEKVLISDNDTLKSGAEDLASLLPDGCIGVMLAYFCNHHSCMTIQDTSKRVGKDEMRKQAASAPTQTPSMFAVGVINGYLRQIMQPGGNKQGIIDQMNACMPALVNEKAVRQEHRSSKQHVQQGMEPGVAGVQQLKRELESAGLHYFRSEPSTCSDPITPDSPLNHEQRWLLVGDAGLALLHRMQPGGDLQLSEMCMDDIHSNISDAKWHTTVGTVWEPARRKMWLVYICYKRGHRTIDFQQTWRDLCDVFGQVLKLHGFQGDAAASHWIALQIECAKQNSRYGCVDFYTLLTIHPAPDGTGGRSFLANPVTGRSR